MKKDKGKRIKDKFRISLILSFILYPLSFSWAVPSFDAAAHTVDSTGTAAPSVSVTVGGACTNRLIVAQVAWWTPGGPGNVSSMTIGGSAATFINGVSPGAAAINRRIELWYRVGVSTGSNTVTATMDGAKDVIIISARSYCGVHQTAAIGISATADNIGNDAAATVDVGSAADELVVDGVMTGSIATSITATAPQTERLNDTTWAGLLLAASSEKTGSATTTMSWAADLADYTGIVAVPLKDVGVAPPAVAVRRRVVGIQ